MKEDIPLFQGMTEEEIRQVEAWTESFSTSEDRLAEIQEMIAVQKTLEGKKRDEELRRKYLKGWMVKVETPDFTTEDVMAERSPEAKKLLLELFPELDSSAEIPLPNIKIESKE